MSRPPRPQRLRIHPYVHPDLAGRIKDYGAARGLTGSQVVHAALTQYLDGTSDMALVLRRLNLLGRALDRIHRDLLLFLEAFAVFVEVWYAHTPSIPKEAEQLALESAADRFARFKEHVVERFQGGPRFIDDLPREVIADDAELRDVAARSTPEAPSSAAAPSPGAGDGR
jgi:hypothetical protein